MNIWKLQQRKGNAEVLFWSTVISAHSELSIMDKFSTVLLYVSKDSMKQGKSSQIVHLTTLFSPFSPGPQHRGWVNHHNAQETNNILTVSKQAHWPLGKFQ